MSVAVSVYALAWVSAARPDACADHLRTSECGAAALDDSLAALVANMGMPVGVAFVIATAFANIAAGMNAAVATVVTKARLGFHNGRSGTMNRRSNEGGGTRQFMGNFVIVFMNLYLNLHLI